MTTIGLVGCAATKLKRPAPARELYTSQLFRKASAYAEANSDRWYVLSAMHGLVDPDTILDPYNFSLGAKNGPFVWDWAKMIAQQVERELAADSDVELLVLAGEQYRLFLHFTDLPARVPMEGMGIGQQLGFLTKEIGSRLRMHASKDRETTT